MVQTKHSKQMAVLDLPNGAVNGSPNGTQPSREDDESRTHLSWWRLNDVEGRQTWDYLEDEEARRKRPQTVAEKWHLNLPTDLPELPEARTPKQAIDNGLTFFSKLQLDEGNWACEYGGPLFLLPGLVIAWYVTNTPIPKPYTIEIKRYLFARQSKSDGGWGLHIEGESSVYGTAMNYITLRILGASEEDPRMVKARGKLHELGGATHGPHWAKFWMSVLGVAEWDIVNPIPPELWLLPDWVPIALWRWWIHIRQVALPMTFVWSRRFVFPLNPLTRSLRQELYTQPYEAVNFSSNRNTIATIDNYNPKSFFLTTLMWLIIWIWNPLFRFHFIVRRAEAWVWELIQAEDRNTGYAGLGPVNAPMNALCCYIQEGPSSYSFRRHLDRFHDYMWMKDEGMLMNGTNGVQVWDTSFTVHAVVECDVASSPKWQPMLHRAHAFLEAQQMRAETYNHKKYYRQERVGAWPFSNNIQGYTVSDCTSEALRAILYLQVDNADTYKSLVPQSRLRAAVDVLLTMQNRSGGFASYEPTRGSTYLEYLNAAEVFGRIMIEYDYPECTTAVVTALSVFQKHYPDYRAPEIKKVKSRAVEYIRRAQAPDGSWYGSWGICFTYAAMFALESLASVGETYQNSGRIRRGCQFLLDRRMPDGAWGESYKSCEEKRYIQHPDGSQVVQTAWACIGLMIAGYGQREPLREALSVIVGRQMRNGEWKQEGIEGVFNMTCMISYPNYKFYFPIKALGMYAKRFGAEDVLF
ncbi:MAG: hypothetical protein Q9160_003148 [Pyrenula sp. 1 TL-2023]